MSRSILHKILYRYKWNDSQNYYYINRITGSLQLKDYCQHIEMAPAKSFWGAKIYKCKKCGLCSK